MPIAPEREAAAAVAAAAVISGTAPSGDPERDLAGALLASLPEALLEADPTDCALSAAAVAALVLAEDAEVESADMAVGGLLKKALRLAQAGAEAASTAREAVYRAVFAVNALRRVKAAEGAPATARQVKREIRHNRAQREASRRRLNADRAEQVAVETWGPVLGWYHLNPTMDPRPLHLAAHGKNHDVRNGTPASTGAKPGALMNCGCVWGPPTDGADYLT